MTAAKQKNSHVDVLIVGAGISGIGSAYHLQDQCPDLSYTILETKETSELQDLPRGQVA